MQRAGRPVRRVSVVPLVVHDPVLDLVSDVPKKLRPVVIERPFVEVESQVTQPVEIDCRPPLESAGVRIIANKRDCSLQVVQDGLQVLAGIASCGVLLAQPLEVGHRYWPVLLIVSMARPASEPLPPETSVRM